MNWLLAIKIREEGYKRKRQMLAEVERLADLHNLEETAIIPRRALRMQGGGVDPEAHSQDLISWEMIPTSSMVIRWFYHNSNAPGYAKDDGFVVWRSIRLVPSTVTVRLEGVLEGVSRRMWVHGRGEDSHVPCLILGNGQSPNGVGRRIEVTSKAEKNLQDWFGLDRYTQSADQI